MIGNFIEEGFYKKGDIFIPNNCCLLEDGYYWVKWEHAGDSDDPEICQLKNGRWICFGIEESMDYGTHKVLSEKITFS